MTVHPTFVADPARGCAERADRDRGGVAAEGRRRQQGIGMLMPSSSILGIKLNQKLQGDLSEW